MASIPNTGTLMETIEDRIEALTGEPKYVTDFEIDITPEQDPEANWSPDCRCKSEYLPKLNQVLDQAMAEFPVVSF